MSKTECSHRWELAGTARGISLTEPRYQDDVGAFLFCVKCLQKETIVYRINKERSGLDAIDNPLIDLLEQQRDLKNKIHSQLTSIQKNLVRLGYYPANITAIVTPLTNLNREITPDDLMPMLKEEHRMMTVTIINSELVG